jgi:hypothetical protein
VRICQGDVASSISASFFVSKIANPAQLQTIIIARQRRNNWQWRIMQSRVVAVWRQRSNEARLSRPMRRLVGSRRASLSLSSSLSHSLPSRVTAGNAAIGHRSVRASITSVIVKNRTFFAGENEKRSQFGPKGGASKKQTVSPQKSRPVVSATKQ